MVARQQPAATVGDYVAVDRRSVDFSAYVRRLRVLLRCVSIMVLVAGAIVVPWGLLVGLLLWLVSPMA